MIFKNKKLQIMWNYSLIIMLISAVGLFSYFAYAVVFDKNISFVQRLMAILAYLIGFQQIASYIITIVRKIKTI